MKFPSRIGEPSKGLYITELFLLSIKCGERFRSMMICMSDLRPGILLHLGFLLQTAFGSLQRVWKEDVDFDSALNSSFRRG
jgi:hypothetical protein